MFAAFLCFVFAFDVFLFGTAMTYTSYRSRLSRNDKLMELPMILQHACRNSSCLYDKYAFSRNIESIPSPVPVVNNFMVCQGEYFQAPLIC
jgi:hypothetical protein